MALYLETVGTNTVSDSTRKSPKFFNIIFYKWNSIWTESYDKFTYFNIYFTNK